MIRLVVSVNLDVPKIPHISYRPLFLSIDSLVIISSRWDRVISNGPDRVLKVQESR